MVVEEEEAILRDSLRLIQQYHDGSRHAMLRVVLAPCSPFSVTRDLMRESAVLAREHGVVYRTPIWPRTTTTWPFRGRSSA